jgi:hypothetical protein
MRTPSRRALLTHSLAMSVGLGIGLLSCADNCTAGAVSVSRLAGALGDATYRATFRRDQPGEHPHYWADGTLGITHDGIAFQGRMDVPASAGPTVTVYLTADRIGSAEDFVRAQPRARRVGLVSPRSRFLLDVPEDIDIEDFTTVVLWSDRGKQLIATARYRTAWEDEVLDD